MIPSVMTNENVKMPSLIYGTAWKGERTAELVEMAVLSGFEGIDTAAQPRHYSEEGVGEALHRLAEAGIERETLFLQTKFTPLSGHDAGKAPYDPAAPLERQVLQSFESSKRNLRSDYVDSLLLHSPLYPYTDLLRGWGAMESLYERGATRQLGISNCYDLELLMRLYDDARIKPAVVQNRFYSQSGYDTPLRKWCAQKGVVYQGFWTLTANPHLLESKTLKRLGRKYGVGEAQILYRFLNQSGIVPLIGSTSKEHLEADLAIFAFELTEEERGAIEGLLEG